MGQGASGPQKRFGTSGGHETYTSVPVLELRSGDLDIHGNVGFCGESAVPKRVIGNWPGFVSSRLV